MSEIIDLGVEKDHIDSLTKASGMTAICELIWNSLDADSTEVRIDYKPAILGGYEYITIKDNGSGLPYSRAKEVFARIGGSEKKIVLQSPNGRAFHGKEGKGRYKSLALGDLVTFRSIYKSDNTFSEFTATFDKNRLSKTEISALTPVSDETEPSTGFWVTIDNVNPKAADEALDIKSRREIEEKFASYWISYPDFKIYFNNKPLEFESLFKNTVQKDFFLEIDGENYRFEIKIIEWNFENKKKTYLCNNQGIPFLETSLGIRSPIPISIFIQSVYIEGLHRDNTLNISAEGGNPHLISAIKEAKDFARDYVRKRLHDYSKEFIAELKSKDLYPYKGEPDNITEETKRQVFDIVALQVNQHLTSFSDQDDKAKKLTLALISEALEHDTKNLRKILSEVIGLPEDKREELSELLDNTSLSNIIDTMTIIKNRLNFLNGLEQIIYDKDLNENILERRHLHKIIVKETWIFGDEYTYGVDDTSLKNVLKAYLKDYLNRDDFEEIVGTDSNDQLGTIPDVCLWQQFSLGSLGKENLVIELKKPTVDAGFTEKTQIESYAAKISQDARFPKDSTRWKCILVTKEIKTEIEPLLKQPGRKYGHVHQGENIDVFVLTWGKIITEARSRYEYIKEKLNLNLQENEEGLAYLKKKYSEYLPDDFNK